MALLNTREINIKFKFMICMFLLVIIPVSAQANVRTVYVNDKNMENIYLNMGKSTILRFNEKPKKVVIGNQNYFQVEFIDSDITIQPQGIVSTNLFAYCENNTYGFILNAHASGRYDDLINVRWKPETSYVLGQKLREPEKSINDKVINRPLDLDGILVNLEKISFDEKRKLHILDIILENIKQKDLHAKNIKINLTRGGKPIKKYFFISEKEILKSKEKSKLRLFIKLENKTAFKLEFCLNDKKVHTIIDKSDL